MKNLIKISCFAVALFFSAKSVTAEDVNMPLVGEWTNNTMNAEISEIKFFPNGLLRVVAKGHGWSARYKVASSSAASSDIYLVQGYIKMGSLVHFADRDRPRKDEKFGANAVENSRLDFTAKLTNHQKTMTLQVDNRGVKKEFMLIKTNDIKTGNIPAN